MTQDIKHTPAPWKLEHDETNREFVIIGSDGHLVTEILDNHDEDKANAYLTTAAPELLEVLELARERIIDLKMTARGRDVVMEEIDAAIAKARGTQ